MALFIAAWLISLLVYYLNASNRRIQLFLDAIEDDESMLYFPEDIGSREQRRLHAAFNRIHMLMTENRRKAFDRELHCKEYESWDKLMHVLTHEIMNSIAPVVSLSGTLLSYFRTKDAPKSSGEITDATIRKTIRGLDTIKSQGQTLMHFTESYRQFAYLKQPEPEPFPLTYLLQNQQTLYLPDMQRQHIDFSLVLFQPEITVHADEKLLSQVLINLLKNAMQALEGQADGKIRMEVDTEKNQLLIRVTDNVLASLPTDRRYLRPLLHHQGYGKRHWVEPFPADHTDAWRRIVGGFATLPGNLLHGFFTCKALRITVS